MLLQYIVKLRHQNIALNDLQLSISCVPHVVLLRMATLKSKWSVAKKNKGNENYAKGLDKKKVDKKKERVGVKRL